MVDNGTDLMYEHHVRNGSGPVANFAVLKFVLVHRVVDGRITLEGLLGHGRAEQSRTRELVGGFRDRRHVLGLRRHRAGLSSPHGDQKPSGEPRGVPMFDLTITGGTVVDGTGADRYRADIGITGGRITEIRRCHGDDRRAA